jgi:hypothetical protein
MGSDKVFIVADRSLIYIMKSKGPKIDPWGNPCFTLPHFEVTFSNYLTSGFLFPVCQTGSEAVSCCSLNAIIM